LTTQAITASFTSEAASTSRTRAFQIAWVLALCFYFVEYAVRSAPAVMIPQLSLAFGTTAVGVSAILGAYYYTYSLTSLIAGAAMIPYTIVKEVNPDEVKGSATGAINFLTFGDTALVGPAFADLVGRGIANTPNHVAHFRESGLFWISSITLAILLSLLLLETGHARREP